ncbi:MAG: nucleotidyltransferase domain-containing protein [Nanoarchaeota archaeon]
MPSPSKEEHVLKLLLENSPLKKWHFEEVVREAQVTKAVANKWLKKYVQDGVLARKKEKGKFPYFTVGSNNSVYYSLKRVYSLERLHKSGLIPKLLSLKTVKTIILFGSLARGDWYKDSDIDLFIFGNLTDFDKNLYESKLKRNIELHVFRDKKEIQEVKTGLIKNVINGYLIKGDLQELVEMSS